MGVTPDDSALAGTALRLRWLCDTFGAEPSPEATEDVVRQFAQAYSLALSAWFCLPINWEIKSVFFY